MSNRPPPNALADLYDGLFTIRKEFSDQTDPLWRLAIESLLFGGDGLAPDMTPYGEQQAEQNSFTMTDYRDRYGNSDRVTEFPAIETASLTVATLSASAAPPDIQVPVTPETGTLVPIRVAAEDRAAALRCLQEFPATPDGKRLAAAPNAKVLAPEAFPELGESSGSDEQQRSQFSNSATSASTDTTSDTTLEPNELAELYDGCRRLLELIPDQSPATAVWQTALEALLYDTDFLRGGICGYGEQQAQRNRFGMATYREAYGDGEAVTQFAAVDSAPPTQADNIPFPDNLTLPATPESQTGLPVTPTEETLADALVLLQEFPATPAADERGGSRADLKMKLDYEALLLAHGFDLDEFTDVLSGSNPGAGSPPVASANNSIEADADNSAASDITATGDDDTAAVDEGASDTPDDQRTVLRKTGVGETVQDDVALTDSAESAVDRKYEDPRAEQAHRRARRRDPEDVVELGEEVTLVLQEADFSTHPATVRGSKQGLVVFVQNPPQDLTTHDTIRVKIVDFGGKRNSAQAEFIGYD